MNILLDTPLPSSVVSKRNYDDKILLIFLALMILLITTGLLLLEAKSENRFTPTNSVNSEESHDTPLYPMFS